MNGVTLHCRLGAVVVAVSALLACLLLGVHAARPVLQSYLAVYVAFLGPVLGSMALLLVHRLAGNGDSGRRVARAVACRHAVLPLLALLLLPILFGAAWLYPWLQATVPGDPDFARHAGISTRRSSCCARCSARRRGCGWHTVCVGGWPMRKATLHFHASPRWD